MLISRKTSVRGRANKRNIDNKQSEATVYLYGDIGGWFGIDPQEWIKEFNAIDASTIHLRIDSGGGDVFAARAMKTTIMQHPSKIIAHIDGLAASAASFFAMGADEIEIVDGGFIMIHNAMSFMDVFGYFNISDLEKLLTDIQREVDLHVKINDSIASDYVKRSGMTKEKVLELMDAETWFTAQEAIDNGMADRIYDGDPVEGNYDLSSFSNTPENVHARNTNFAKREIEKALRDAGLSNKEAKKILSEGFKSDVRDASPESEPGQTVDDDQRDVDVPKPKKDPVAELLTRAYAMI